MAGDKMREMLENLVMNVYDGLLKWMDEEKKETMTREEIMKFKLNFQSRMDLK